MYSMDDTITVCYPPFPEIGEMTTGELSSFLVSEIHGMSDDDAKELEGKFVKTCMVALIRACSQTDRNIDGKEFLGLTREDLNIIYPTKQKFLIASRLYKLATQSRSETRTREDINTVALLNELSDLENINVDTSSSSIGTPASS